MLIVKDADYYSNLVYKRTYERVDPKTEKIRTFDETIKIFNKWLQPLAITDVDQAVVTEK